MCVRRLGEDYSKRWCHWAKENFLDVELLAGNTDDAEAEGR